MYLATLLPKNQPMRGMANWKPPNHSPILALCFRPKPGVEMPVETDTAKASRARETAMRKISITKTTPTIKGKKNHSTNPRNMLQLFANTGR